MPARKYDWETEIKPWMLENHAELSSDWKRSRTKSDKATVQVYARRAYGAYVRRLDPEVREKHNIGQKSRYQEDAKFRGEQHKRTRKAQIIGKGQSSGLVGRIIPLLKELGSESEVKTAQDLVEKLRSRGYVLTQADIDVYDILSKDAKSLETAARQTRKRFRPPYGLTDTELKNFHQELWKYEEGKRAFNQKLRGLVEDGSISEAKFNRFRLTPGHGLSASTFPEFQSQVNNIFAETLKHNQGAGVRLTGAQVLNRVKSLLTGEGVGIESVTRKRLNEFAKLAESKGFNPDFIYKSRHGVEKPFNMNELLRYFTGYGFEGEHGLAGVKKIDPLFKREPLTPEKQRKLTQETIEKVKGGLMTWGKKAVSKAPLVGSLLTPGIAKAYWDEGQKGKAISSLLGVAGIIPEFLFDWEKMGKGFQESLSRTKEARESRYENLLMDRRHRQRRKELKGQGLLGLNI